MEFHLKYRPEAVEQLVHQPAVKEQVLSWKKSGEYPHALLMYGHTGTGKTTTARIFRDLIGCVGSDYVEINAADARGIDTIRQAIRDRTSLPMLGTAKMWVFDEAHRATSDAMVAMLKLLEDYPPHCYYVLCTTDPSKLLPTILNRCKQLKFDEIPATALTGLVSAVMVNEYGRADPALALSIAEAAEGAARKALVLLEQCMAISAPERMAYLEKSKGISRGDNVARLLIEGANWDKVCGSMADCDEEPESVRRRVMGYAAAVLVKVDGERRQRAYRVLKAFGPTVMYSGRPGLLTACYEACFPKEG